MCNTFDVKLGEQYMIRDKSTSEGSQIKYNKDNIWYKIDNLGGEGESEALVSLLLECSNLAKEAYVHYQKCTINESPGCLSPEFRHDTSSEEFITFYRLYRNIYGNDLASVTSKMDYDDAINYVCDFVQRYSQLDIHEYLANTLFLDEIILNTDRHFNNYGIIMSADGVFRTAPIFDNGKSLLVGYKGSKSTSNIPKAVKEAYSKSFSPSFALNSMYTKNFRTMEIDKELTISKLQDYPDSFQKEVLLYQISRLL